MGRGEGRVAERRRRKWGEKKAEEWGEEGRERDGVSRSRVIKDIYI